MQFGQRLEDAFDATLRHWTTDKNVRQYSQPFSHSRSSKQDVEAWGQKLAESLLQSCPTVPAWKSRLRQQNSDSNLDRFWFEACRDTKRKRFRVSKRITNNEAMWKIIGHTTRHSSLSLQKVSLTQKCEQAFGFPDVQYLLDGLAGSWITTAAEGDLMLKDQDYVSFWPSYFLAESRESFGNNAMYEATDNWKVKMTWHQAQRSMTWRVTVTPRRIITASCSWA